MSYNARYVSSAISSDTGVTDIVELGSGTTLDDVKSVTSSSPKYGEIFVELNIKGTGQKYVNDSLINVEGEAKIPTTGIGQCNNGECIVRCTCNEANGWYSSNLFGSESISVTTKRKAKSGASIGYAYHDNEQTPKVSQHTCYHKKSNGYYKLKIQPQYTKKYIPYKSGVGSRRIQTDVKFKLMHDPAENVRMVTIGGKDATSLGAYLPVPGYEKNDECTPDATRPEYLYCNNSGDEQLNKKDGFWIFGGELYYTQDGNYSYPVIEETQIYSVNFDISSRAVGLYVADPNDFNGEPRMFDWAKQTYQFGTTIPIKDTIVVINADKVEKTYVGGEIEILAPVTCSDPCEGNGIFYEGEDKPDDYKNNEYFAISYQKVDETVTDSCGNTGHCWKEYCADKTVANLPKISVDIPTKSYADTSPLYYGVQYGSKPDYIPVYGNERLFLKTVIYYPENQEIMYTNTSGTRAFYVSNTNGEIADSNSPQEHSITSNNLSFNAVQIIDLKLSNDNDSPTVMNGDVLEYKKLDPHQCFVLDINDHHYVKTCSMSGWVSQTECLEQGKKCYNQHNIGDDVCCDSCYSGDCPPDQYYDAGACKDKHSVSFQLASMISRDTNMEPYSAETNKLSYNNQWYGGLTIPDEEDFGVGARFDIEMVTGTYRYTYASGRINYGFNANSTSIAKYTIEIGDDRMPTRCYKNGEEDSSWEYDKNTRTVYFKDVAVQGSAYFGGWGYDGWARDGFCCGSWKNENNNIPACWNEHAYPICPQAKDKEVCCVSYTNDLNPWHLARECLNQEMPLCGKTSAWVTPPYETLEKKNICALHPLEYPVHRITVTTSDKKHMYVLGGINTNNSADAMTYLQEQYPNIDMNKSDNYASWFGDSDCATRFVDPQQNAAKLEDHVKRLQTIYNYN